MTYFGGTLDARLLPEVDLVPSGASWQRPRCHGGLLAIKAELACISEATLYRITLWKRRSGLRLLEYAAGVTGRSAE